MEKAQLPMFAELSLGDTEDSTSASTRKFIGTENPRCLRAIHSLLLRPLSREQLDRTAGASNGPELVAELRRRGLALPCTRTPVIDRDGRIVRRGIYSLTEGDCRQVRKFFAAMRRTA